MSFSFENQGTNTYLVYTIQPEDQIDTMSLGMITNNKIPGLAAAQFVQIDTEKYIKYNISSHVSAKQFFSGAVNKKRLVGVFAGIVDAMLSAEDYMLDPSSIVLDLDYIFADVSSCDAEVVCLPLMNSNRTNPEFGAFLKNIIFNTQFDQTENCDHVAQILNYLNSNPILSLAEFKEVLENIRTPKAAQPAPQPVAQPAPQPVAQPAPQPVVQKPAPQPVAQPAPQPVAQPVPQPRPAVQQPVPPRPAAQPVPQRPVAPAVPPRPQPGFAVPGAPAAAPAKNAVPAAPQTGEKPMTMMYLLQHYNKENAAIYKAQQEAKKAQKGAPAAAPMPNPNANYTVPGAPKAQPNAGYAVPGAPKAQPNAGFAVPGAPAPNAGYAVPGAPKAQPNAGFAVPGTPAPNAGFAVPGAPAAQPKPAQPVVQPPVQQAPVYQAPAAPAAPINFGETTVLGGGAIGETTVLSGNAEPTKNNPHLIRVKNNERIPLNKPVFRIGKERSYVDYFIGDNTAISRSHANIINRNDEFFVVDTNSTNHTYVNGGMIQSNVETKLTHGAKLCLANEEFEFKLY